MNGRYYSSEIKQFVSSLPAEMMMDNVGVIYGLNMYLLTTENPVNSIYNGYTIETNIPLSYEPKKLSSWDRFWRSGAGKVTAGVLTTLGIVVAIATGTVGIFVASLVVGGGMLVVGATIAGFMSNGQGYGFERGFKDYIQNEWALNVAIDSVFFLATVGFSKIIQFARVGNKNSVLPNTNLSPKCFIKGTIVKTGDGDKPIEEIKVGDKVWAYEEETGEKALKEVVQLFRNTTDTWVHVDIESEDKTETITCTKEHPFYILNATDTPIVEFEGRESSDYQGQWVAAKDLKVGHKVLLSSGKNGIISKVETEELDKLETTYNFEVEDYHTYYVGEEGILVHNACGGDLIDDIANSADDQIIMDIQGSGKYGSYDIQFQSGNRYIGKGGQRRMWDSAVRLSTQYDDVVAVAKWRPSISNRTAFIQEAQWMKNTGWMGKGTPGFYNINNSPGVNYLKLGG